MEYIISNFLRTTFKVSKVSVAKKWSFFMTFAIKRR